MVRSRPGRSAKTHCTTKDSSLRKQSNELVLPAKLRALRCPRASASAHLEPDRRPTLTPAAPSPPQLTLW
jgi:hypothetical protein